MGKATTRTGNDVRTCECGHAGMWHPENGACRINGCGCPVFEWGTIRYRNPHRYGTAETRSLDGHRRRG